MADDDSALEYDDETGDITTITEKPSVLHMLSTIDNPYNPFTHWDEWLAFDTMKGYNTNSFLARVARVSEEMSPADQDIQHEQAIIDIVNQDVLDLYIRVPDPADI